MLQLGPTRSDGAELAFQICPELGRVGSIELAREPLLLVIEPGQFAGELERTTLAGGRARVRTGGIAR